MISKIYHKEDLMLSVALSYLVLNYMLEIMLSAAFNRIGLSGTLISGYLVSLIWYAFLMVNLPTVIRRSNMRLWIMPLVLTIMLLFSMLRYSYVENYISYSYILLVKCIPAFIIMASLKKYHVFNYVIKVTSYILYLFCIIYFFFYSMKIDNRSIGYDMVFGYEASLATMLMFENYLKSNKIINLLFVIIGVALVIIRGSRGSLFTLVIYFIVKMFINQRKNSKKLLLIIGTAIISILTYNHLEMIISNTIVVMANYGIYSRTLSSMLESTIIDSNGRDAIYNVLIYDIKENPIWGYGLFADRIKLNSGYAHNLAVEFLYNYGLIVGVLLLTSLVTGILKVILNDNKNNYFAAFSMFTIGSLMFSGSYLTSYYFYIMLGMLLSKSCYQCQNARLNVK